MLAEEERFELPVGCPTVVFKTTALDHSATPPVPADEEDLAGNRGRCSAHDRRGHFTVVTGLVPELGRVPRVSHSRVRDHLPLRCAALEEHLAIDRLRVVGVDLREIDYDLRK